MVTRVVALSDERDLWMRCVLAAWQDGYGTAAEDLADVRVSSFADGWRLGLLAGSERGTAA